MAFLYDVGSKAEASTEAGILRAHREAFLNVAYQMKAIIMVRAPGKFCTGLINDGYDSKSMLNHAKSCNWGPMAGFVLERPMFSKDGLTQRGWQRQEHALGEAVLNGSGTTRLIITERRRKELVNKGVIATDPRASNNAIDAALEAVRPTSTSSVLRYQATCADPIADKKRPPEDDRLTKAQNIRFFLIALKQKDIDGTPLWAVYWWHPVHNDLRRVMAMVDPIWQTNAQNQLATLDQYSDTTKVTYGRVAANMPEHKKACTGDYDLFAIWRFRKACPQPQQDVLDYTNFQWNDKTGLITPFYSKCIVWLNEALNQRRWGDPDEGWDIAKEDKSAYCNFDYKGGELLHHSAEVARPAAGVSNVDLPVIAFLPWNLGLDSRTVYFDDIADFQQVVDLAKEQFEVQLHPNWIGNGDNQLPQTYRPYQVMSLVRLNQLSAGH